MSKTLTYILAVKDELTPGHQKAAKNVVKDDEVMAASSAKTSKAIEETGKKASKSGGLMSSAFSNAGIATLGLGTLVGGFLTKAIGDARSEGFAKLGVAVNDTGASMDKMLPKIKATGSTMAKLGFSQAQTNAALTTLVTITGSTSVAMKTMGGAADLARYKGISLAQASLTLGKASVGSTRALKDLGISTTDLPKHFGTTGTAATRMALIMDLLNKKIGGQAATYAGTFGGKLAVVKAQMENLSATIGAALLPVLSTLLSAIASKVLPALQRFGVWLETVGIPKLKQLALNIMPVVNTVFTYFFTGVSKVIKVISGLPVPLKIAAIAVIALGVAMKLAAAANPWVLLAIAIFVVIGAIVKNWGRIRDIFNVVRDAILSGWKRVTDFLGNAFRAAYNNVIRPYINFLWQTISAVFGFIINGAARAFGWVPGLGGKLRAAASKFNTFRQDVSNAINGIKGKNISVGVAMTSSSNPFPGGISGRAATGRHIRGPGTSTSDTAGLYALSNGEYVIRAASVSKYGVGFMNAVNAGHLAAGGGVGTGLNVTAHTPSADSIGHNIWSSVVKYVKNHWAGNLGGALSLAESFIGKVPYVWGGASPSGWDCSGFVSWIYNKLGLHRGRDTAAGLQNWARSSGPVPGGMAFYGSPAHHVGFVMDGSHLVSALGRKWGTTVSSLNLGDNSGYGVPPGSGGGVGGASAKGSLQELAFAMLSQRGWGGQWGAFDSLENREAGWRMNAVNPSSGAYGLAQFINGAGEYAQYGGTWLTAAGQLTGMMNYIAQRYGSPNAAWGHEVAAGWYSKGGPVTSFDTGHGILRPGFSIAHNGTGRNEYLSTGGTGTTININVSPTPLARPADIGRSVVGAIREYEKHSGKGWRS